MLNLSLSITTAVCGRLNKAVWQGFVFSYAGQVNGKDSYFSLLTGYTISWSIGFWFVFDSTSALADQSSASEDAKPWIATGWIDQVTQA